MAKRALSLFLVLFTLGSVGCDHATKLAAKAALGEGRSVSLVPGLLDLRYTENHDTAFSLLRLLGLSSSSATLSILSLIALGAVAAFWWSRRKMATRLEHLGFALAVSGAIGNVIDRVFRGYVVDFIHLHHWPVFNVADVAVVVGLALVAFGHRAGRSNEVAT
jgi:signal peptidase II